MRVCPYRASLFEDFFGTLDDIGWESILCQCHQFRVLCQRRNLDTLSIEPDREVMTHLSCKSDSRLVQPLLLWIPDVRGDDLAER